MKEVDTSGANGSSGSALSAFVRSEMVVFVVLGIGFVARWLLAGSQSYWLDELYSDAIYELVPDFLFRRNLTSFGMALVLGGPLVVIIRAAMTIVPPPVNRPRGTF